MRGYKLGTTSGKLSLAWSLLFVASSPSGRPKGWLVLFLPRLVYVVNRFQDVVVQFIL